MRVHYPDSMRGLIDELSKLPSVGERTAVRLAYHIISNNSQGSLRLAEAITGAIEQIRLCERCFFFTEDSSGLCPICLDDKREASVLCVVEKPADVIAIEKTRGYNGLYHVLHGLWSPLRGQGPEVTKLGNLLKRLRQELECDDTLGKSPLREVVLATGTTIEGDATALYVAEALNDSKITVTRIAQGLPKGGELEYADEVTLSHALQGRKNI